MTHHGLFSFQVHQLHVSVAEKIESGHDARFLRKAPLSVAFIESLRSFRTTTTKSIWISINCAEYSKWIRSLVRWPTTCLFKGSLNWLLWHIFTSRATSFAKVSMKFPSATTQLRLGGQISYGHSYKNHLKRLRINQFTNQSVTSNSYSRNLKHIKMKIVLLVSVECEGIDYATISESLWQ